MDESGTWLEMAAFAMVLWGGVAGLIVFAGREVRRSEEPRQRQTTKKARAGVPAITSRRSKPGLQPW